MTSQADVSRETLQKLHLYEALLKKWQKKVNLVSSSTIDDAWDRHFVDSMQVADFIADKDANIVDIGSGAGFPGLVLAIMGYKNVTLIEADLKKTLFLREVARQTQVDVTILNERIEGVDISADILTARALASLKDLMTYAKNILNKNSKALFLKGENFESELFEAKKVFDFSCVVHQSQTSDKGKILEINVSRET